MQKQRGSALISALLLMSIVTMLSIGMLSRQDLEIRRTESIFQQERLLAEASWVELWAKGILQSVANQITPETDYITLEQIWALPLEAFQREGLQISGQIYDLQSLFNINNVLINNVKEEEEEQAAEQENPSQTPQEQQAQRDAEQKQQEVEQELTPADFLTDEDLYTPAWMFTRLLENQATLPAVQSRALTEALLYWIMPAETEMDNYYLKLPQPYRPAHQLLWSISELRLVQGVNNEIFSAIQPFISALPVNTRVASTAPSGATQGGSELITVNINTTTPELLAAILKAEVADAKSVLASRPYYTQESLQEQLNKIVDKEKGGGNAVSMIGITSKYFLVRAEVQDDRRKLVQYSILHLNPEEGIKVLKRVQGEL
ncbi:MAG: type II secretion system minor pseudopilin GspK [Gammaproteobacteria bacterium]